LHVLDLLVALGYTRRHGDTLDPEVAPAERPNYHAAILAQQFRAAVQAINARVPAEAIDSAIHQVLDVQLPDLIQENRRLHRLLTHGVPVEYSVRGETIHDRVWLVDWSGHHNQWLAVPQLTIVGSHQRRPDIILYLNGLPVVVLELKAPESAVADTRAAFHQLQTYKRDIPALFRTNALCVISDGFAASYGTLSADFDRFMRWRTIDGVKLVAPAHRPVPLRALLPLESSIAKLSAPGACASMGISA
jgi:type I restriction enzyme R subunit